jgi:hypothetical protein
MDGVTRANEGLGIFGASIHHDFHVGIELIDEGSVRGGGDFLESVGEFAEGLVADVLIRVGAFFFDGLRREKRDAGAGSGELFGEFGLAARVGGENIRAKRLI